MAGKVALHPRSQRRPSGPGHTGAFHRGHHALIAAADGAGNITRCPATSCRTAPTEQHSGHGQQFETPTPSHEWMFDLVLLHNCTVQKNRTPPIERRRRHPSDGGLAQGDCSLPDTKMQKTSLPRLRPVSHKFPLRQQFATFFLNNPACFSNHTPGAWASRDLRLRKKAKGMPIVKMRATCAQQKGTERRLQAIMVPQPLGRDPQEGKTFRNQDPAPVGRMSASTATSRLAAA